MAKVYPKADGVTRFMVRDLRVGDVLPTTRRKVVSTPTAGLRTGNGRVQLVVEDLQSGVRTLVEWNASTVIKIEARR